MRPDQTHGHLDEACADGEHELVRSREGTAIRHCKHCGLDSATISDYLDHETTS